MNEKNKMTRRDWFRLRAPHQNQMLDQSAPANTVTDAEADPQMDALNASPPEVKDVMTAVAHPPNHDGMDLSELPPMREAILSPAQVESLFLDIEKLATEVLLMQRSTKTVARQCATKGNNFAATQPRQGCVVDWQSASHSTALPLAGQALDRHLREKARRLSHRPHRSPRHPVLILLDDSAE